MSSTLLKKQKEHLPPPEGSTNSSKKETNPAEEHVNKLMVNLLPSEILLQRRQSVKLALINKLSIASLLVLIFFASATLGLRISQNFALKNAQQNLVYAEDKVSSFKDKEVEMAVLKQRLNSIKSLLGGDSKITTIFNLVVFLTPSDIQITEASVDKNGSMILTLVAPGLPSLETLISNLGSKEKNSDLISKVELQGLSLGRDSTYRLVLKITPKN